MAEGGRREVRRREERRRFIVGHLWLLGAVLGCLGSGCSRSNPSSDLSHLLAGYRPFVARLSVEGPHRPCGAKPPFCDAAPRPGESEFRAFAALSLRRTDDDPVSERASILAGLIGSSAGQGIAESVDLLAAASRESPRDASLAGDLAAATLVQAELTGGLDLRLTALDRAIRAHELNPASIRARFNLALALESIPALRDEARREWRRVEEAETDSAWLSEAAEHRRRLETPTGREEWERWQGQLEAALDGTSQVDPEVATGRFSQQVRLWVEDRLLPAWGAAVEAGDEPAAARRLHLAASLAAGLRRRGSGRTIEDSLGAIRTVAEQPARRRELARAHRLYGEARTAHEAQDYVHAAPLFREAAELFERQRSPFAVWPRFFLAFGKAYEEPPNYTAALKSLEALRRRLADGDPVPRAYVEWMIDYVLSYRGELAAALRAVGSARALFAKAGEEENVTAMFADSGEWLRRMGEGEQAWRRWGEALGRFDLLVKSRRIQNTLSGIASQLDEEGRSRAARYFRDAWVEEAERSGNPMSRALAHSSRAPGLVASGSPRRPEPTWPLRSPRRRRFETPVRAPRRASRSFSPKPTS